MKIAVFSDVHGNYVNLLSFYESTLHLGIDKYICLGDLSNYYPDNKAVIDFIRTKNITCILGNHDEFYLPGKELSAEKKTRYSFDEQLVYSKESIDFLEKLPIKYELTVNDRSILFCHASPIDYLYSYIYPDTDLKMYASTSYDFVFMGHTHRQFLRSINGKLFCNVGSIGLPRDNGSLMGFAVLETDTLEIVLYRKEIEINKVKETYKDRVNNDVIDLMSRRESLDYKYTLL